VRYVVANPSSYLYFSSDRPISNAEECPSLDHWKYGFGLDITAGEAMWDAILSSVPENTEVSAVATAVSPMNIGRLAGSYRFGDNVVIDVWEQNGALLLRPRGDIGFFDLQDRAIKLIATSDSDFYVNSQFRTRISFVTSESGKVTGAEINPGRWALSGQRITDSKR
jgi:hypothetical protein